MDGLVIILKHTNLRKNMISSLYLDVKHIGSKIDMKRIEQMLISLFLQKMKMGAEQLTEFCL